MRRPTPQARTFVLNSCHISFRFGLLDKEASVPELVQLTSQVDIRVGGPAHAWQSAPGAPWLGRWLYGRAAIRTVWHTISMGGA